MNEQPRNPEKSRPVNEAEKHIATGRMHENVTESSDPVCPCEAEPYWQALKDEPETLEDQEGGDPC